MSDAYIIKGGIAVKKIGVSLFCLVVLLVIAGCQSMPGRSSSDDPKAAFEQFVLAIKNNNLDKAWDLLSDDAKKQFDENGQPSIARFKEKLSKELQDQEKRAAIVNSQVQEVKITAVLKVQFTDKDKTRTDDVPLIKEQGRWKINFN
jgi:hypothetical protein